MQGAEPNMGRKLAHMLIAAGCRQVNAGLLGGHWGQYNDLSAFQSEWETLRADLPGMINDTSLKELYEIDLHAWQKGERILFVPTFYAWGQNPE